VLVKRQKKGFCCEEKVNYAAIANLNYLHL